MKFDTLFLIESAVNFLCWTCNKSWYRPYGRINFDELLTIMTLHGEELEIPEDNNWWKEEENRTDD